MYLIDSNIIIYSYLNEYQHLRDIITQESAFISEISKVEVLGYHALTKDEEIYFQRIFDFVPTILPSQQILNTATIIRKQYNLKLGDSIIGATAIVHDLQIYTRNLKDFEKIANLKCSNPIAKDQ